MILYFDVYIIDSPLTSDTVKSIKYIRNGNSVYKMPKKLDITKYTLASYKIFPWSHVFIKFDVANEENREPFLKYTRELFPDAEIIDHRSDNQKEYCKTINSICKLDDDWIFFAPNNDHPMMTNDIKNINIIIKKADEYKEKYKFVSIIYTMFPEYNSINHTDYYKDTKILEDSDIALVTLKPNGFFISGLILHKDFMRYLFCSKDLGNRRVTRIEDLQDIEVKDQVVISPKKEICVHFDGHSNTYGLSTEITPDQVPPLFIPPGFFSNNIRISYGYKEYQDGWVNINPSVKHYSFRNKHNKTDLKICLEDIPLFWKDKISKIDINPDVNHTYLKSKIDEYYEIRKNPWKDPIYKLKIRIKSFLYHNIYVSSIIFLRSLKKHVI